LCERFGEWHEIDNRAGGQVSGIFVQYRKPIKFHVDDKIAEPSWGYFIATRPLPRSRLARRYLRRPGSREGNVGTGPGES
jgi:hypothetical protein